MCTVIPGSRMQFPCKVGSTMALEHVSKKILPAFTDHSKPSPSKHSHILNQNLCLGKYQHSIGHNSTTVKSPSTLRITPISFVAFGESLNLAMPQLPYKIVLIKVATFKINYIRLIGITHLGKCLAHIRWYLHFCVFIFILD